MRYCKFFALGLLVSLSQLLLGQKVFSGEGTSVLDSIPFELTNHNNISVVAILNRVDTLNLMFHTAAGSMTLIEESVKRLTTITWNEE